MAHVAEATHTGPWSSPSIDIHSRELLEKLKEQQERLDTWSKLANYLIRDRERMRLGRDPTEAELLEARQRLGRDVDVPRDFTTENELRRALADLADENQRMREYNSATAGIQASHPQVRDERTEALQSALTLQQNKAETLELELRNERKEHRLLLAEKREWEDLEEEYLSKIEQLRTKLSTETQTISSENDKGKLELIKKNQEEVSNLRKALDDSRRKNEFLQKQMETLNSRIMDKDQSAELVYQKSLQFQELQRQELTKQLNWVISEQSRERAEFEAELALKEKEIRALETQSQIRSDFGGKQADATQAAVQQANQSADTRLRDELDRVRLDSEKQAFEYNSKVRELEQQINAQRAEVQSMTAKYEKAEQTSHERYTRLTQYQDKINKLNGEVRRLEKEIESIEAAKTVEAEKAVGELKRQIETLEHDNVLLRESKEMVEASVETESRRRREELDAREKAYTDLSRKLEVECMARRKEADQHQREARELKENICEKELALHSAKEERVLLEDELSRLKEKCEDILRELKVTTDNSARLMERDGQLVSECHTAKICWHQCKLELERSERDRSRLAAQNARLRKQITSTDPLLLLAHKPSGHSRQPKPAYTLDPRDSLEQFDRHHPKDYDS